jgi:hypothetical protein
LQSSIKLNDIGSRPRDKVAPSCTVWYVAAAIALALLGGEIWAWRRDDDTHFRFQLLKSLNMMRMSADPIPEQPDKSLDLPGEGNLLVRSREDGPPRETPYVLGGKAIPEADRVAKQVKIDASEVTPGKGVFIIGDSAAFGFPLKYADSFAARLDQELGPRGFEVYNVAETGWNSGSMMPVARRVLNYYSPHTLIVYMGNNEWISWTPDIRSFSPWIVDVPSWFAQSRLIAFGEYILLRHWVNTSRKGMKGFNSQEQLSGISYAIERPASHPPVYWTETKRKFLENYEAHLRAMLALAKERGVRVLLLTVPFNYKLSPAWKVQQPLAFDPRNQAAVEARVQEAYQAYLRGDSAGALRAAEAALAIEPSVPVPRYLKAAALEKLNRFSESEAEYALVRENMIGNLGSILSINEVIRSVAAETGVELLDVVKLFDRDEHMRGRYFNETLILDDCHPSPLGHQLIADAIAARFLK